MSWYNNNYNNRNENGVVIPISNGGAVITGRVRNGTQIVSTVKRKKRKNYIKETFTIRGESYLPTEQGRKVIGSSGAIKARASKPKD